MEIPDGFCIESNIGMFLMKAEGSSFGKRRFKGTANGFSIDLALDAKGNNKASVTSERYGLDPIRSKGRAQTFQGLLFQLSDWMDSEYWDTAVERIDEDTRYLETSNGKIAYWCFNEHIDSVPVIFLHGGPGDESSVTRPRRMHLMHPVYSYDQLGCGRSDPIPNIKEWDHEDYFSELNGFIEKMGFEMVILIGASWGAGLAAGYAIRYGCDKIECMVIPSPFVSSKRWEEDQMVNLRSLPQEYQDEMDEFLKGNGSMKNYRHVMSEYYSRFLFTRECNREIAYEAGQTEQNEVFKAMWGDNDLVCTGNMRDFDLISELGKITVPVLLMCGDSDEVTMDTMLEYQRSIKDSRLSVIPFAGHVLSGEQPESYTEAVKAFLREIGH